MSLVQKQEMTEKNLAAKRSNGRRTQGPATARGKARSAAANLRHGFYAEARDEALPALGEDPRDYVRLLKSLVKDLEPREGLESELVGRMARALWRMKRAERIQNGLAKKRVERGIQSEGTTMIFAYDRVDQTVKRLQSLAAALARPDYVPTPGEIQGIAQVFESSPSDASKTILTLLESLRKLTPQRPGPPSQGPGTEPGAKAEGQKPERARRELQALVAQQIDSFGLARVQLQDQFMAIESPENRAALMAPRDENALLLQRMEDSSLRQLWRLTNTLIKVRNGALTGSVKSFMKANEGWGGG